MNMVRIKANRWHRHVKTCVDAYQKKIEEEQKIRDVRHLLSTDVFKMYLDDNMDDNSQVLFEKASGLLEKALIESMECERMNVTPKRENKPWVTVLTLYDVMNDKSYSMIEFIWDIYALLGVRFDLISTETVNEILSIKKYNSKK